MSLTFDTGKKLLKEIVGGTGFHNYGVTTYLALCYDQPYYEAKAGTYNVNEPTALGYSRVQLPSDYFGNEIILPGGGTKPNPYSEETKERDIVTEYKVTIENTKEIHFQEAQEPWGTVKYFAIMPSATYSAGESPLYIGTLLNYVINPNVTASNFAELVAEGLYVKDAAEYTGYRKLTDLDTYSSSETYYDLADGLEILGGTVPLIRAGYLKISVK